MSVATMLLGAAVGSLVLLGLNRLRVTAIGPYVVVGPGHLGFRP